MSEKSIKDPLSIKNHPDVTSLSREELHKALEREKNNRLEKESELKNLQTQFKEHTEKLERELEVRESIEKHLDDQRAFLRKVIDLNPNFVFAKDRGFKFTLVNKAVADAYGTTTEDLIGKGDADFNSNQEEVEHFQKNDLAVMESQEQRIVPEEVITDSTGNIRWLRTVKIPILDESGYATHVLGVASDITQLKLNKERLAQLAAIVQSTNDAIVSACSKGLITTWNSAAEKMFGYTAQEAIGQPISLVYRPELIELENDRLPADSSVANLREIEIPYQRKDGGRIYLGLTISPIFDDKGNTIGTSAIARDITRRVRTERELHAHREHLAQLVDEKTRELAESQERLRTAERMAALGALASGIAHEINNPIGAILLANENALEQFDEIRGDPKEISKIFKRTAEKTISNAHRCAMIIKDALLFARKKDTRKWSAQLNPIIVAATQFLKQYCSSKNATIELDLAENLPDVIINPLEIEQVLVNLIKNSVESSPNDPKVKISTSTTDAGHVLLQVSDQGSGIPEKVRKRIFEAFYTTRAKEGGTGLGLNIVKEIVKGHKGEIELESKVGVGTKFSIVLRT